MTAADTHAAPGMVYIFWAGPGAADLLTLRAVDRLQPAEVVVHDRLIAPEVLALIPRAVVRTYVGKALGNHCVPQEGIHVLRVQHARAGRCVVRLKGADPLRFRSRRAGGAGVAGRPHRLRGGTGCHGSRGLRGRGGHSGDPP